MKIEYKGKTVELKNGTFRSYLYWEELTGRNINTLNTSLTDTVKMMYCALIASDQDRQYEFDEFVNYLDKNPEIFNEWVESLKKFNLNKKKVTQKAKVKN